MALSKMSTPTIIIRFAGRSIRSHAVSTELIFSRLRMGVDCRGCRILCAYNTGNAFAGEMQ